MAAIAGPGGSPRRSMPLHVILFCHLRNTVAGALSPPHCLSSGDEISHGRRTVIAAIRQTDHCARRTFINRKVEHRVEQNVIHRARHDRYAQASSHQRDN